MAKTSKRKKKASGGTGKQKGPKITSEQLFQLGSVQFNRALLASAGVAQVITGQEIVRRLTVLFNRPIDSPDDPISKYIRGGAGAIRAFPIALNRSGIFSTDGITFVLGAFDRFSKIGQLGAAIVEKYRQKGWYVH